MGLVNLRKVSNLFQEPGSLDNDVDCGARQTADFHFNIKHSNPSTGLSRISTKLSGMIHNFLFYSRQSISNNSVRAYNIKIIFRLPIHFLC
jgi:hypothetical protein